MLPPAVEERTRLLPEQKMRSAESQKHVNIFSGIGRGIGESGWATSPCLARHEHAMDRGPIERRVGAGKGFIGFLILHRFQLLTPLLVGLTARYRSAAKILAAPQITEAVRP
jgi:hypothetical protein